MLMWCERAEEITDKISLFLPVDVIKNRWKNLKDGMMRCLKKMSIESKSGSGAAKLPTCQFYEQLLFLKDSISNNKSTSSNLTLSTPGAFGSVDLINSGENCDGLLETNDPSPENESSFQKHKSCSPLDTPSTKKKQRTQQKADERRDNIDLLLVNALSKCDNYETAVHPSSNEENSNLFFCKSLVPILENLPPKKNRLARLEIQKLLIDFEFND